MDRKCGVKGFGDKSARGPHVKQVKVVQSVNNDLHACKFFGAKIQVMYPFESGFRW